MKDKSNRKANGQEADASIHGDGAPPHSERSEPAPGPLSGVLSPAQSGSIFEMQTGLFNLGRNRARESGTTESRREDVLALTEHARAMAKQTYRDKYNPKQNVHDAMHEVEYRRALARREESEKAEAHAAANLRDADVQLAKSPKAGEKPAPHLLLIAAFIVAITLTVAPTLHDALFYTLGDEMLAWFASILSAAFVGGMLTLAILSGRRSTWTWVGVGAGLLLGAGLSAVRLSSAQGAGEAWFAIGLTVVEMAAVLLLEWLASGLRNSEDEWRLKHVVETEAIDARDAAQADLERWQARIKQLNDAITAKIAFVEDRHHRNIHIGELEAVAIKAVLDGYNAGIAENIGRVRSVARREE